jgi:SAM-dependent methyltransferase
MPQNRFAACYVSSMDPLAGSQWSASDTVAGFAKSAPNAVLMKFAEEELRRSGSARALDLGCGAGRNAVPLARLGWEVVGVDLSWSMLCAAATRTREGRLEGRLHLVLAPMERIPARDRCFDLVVAHGIWNLARSGVQFRQALGEAARVAKPGAGLFVFTFSRNTFPPETECVVGEPFVFTQFSGEPQCFLTEAQLVAELGGVGFAPDPGVSFREYNRPQPGALLSGTMPVIYEAAFRREG